MGTTWGTWDSFRVRRKRASGREFGRSRKHRKRRNAGGCHSAGSGDDGDVASPGVPEKIACVLWMFF